MTLFKKFHSRTLLYSMLWLTLCLPGCSAIHDSLKGEQGAQGPKLTGNWVRYIGLLDASGKLVNDKSGVTVTVTNPSELSASALTSPIVATTNSDGKFVIKNLQSGTYTLTFSKQGYGEMKVYNQGFVGDGDQVLGPVPGSVVRYYLSAIPEYRITSATVDASFLHNPYYRAISYKSDLPSSYSYHRIVRIFIGLTADVSKDNYLITFTQYLYSVDTHGSFQVSLGLDEELETLPAGDYYCVTYLGGYQFFDESALPASTYFDPVLGRNVYTSLGDPSEVVPFNKP